MLHLLVLWMAMSMTLESSMVWVVVLPPELTVHESMVTVCAERVSSWSVRLSQSVYVRLPVELPGVYW